MRRHDVQKGFNCEHTSAEVLDREPRRIETGVGVGNKPAVGSGICRNNVGRLPEILGAATDDSR